MSLNLQTKQRHCAVLHFLYLQRKNPLRDKVYLSKPLSHSTAESTFQRVWLHGSECGSMVRAFQKVELECHTKISSLLNDEDVQLFVREFISTKKEEITAPLLGFFFFFFFFIKRMQPPRLWRYQKGLAPLSL